MFKTAALKTESENRTIIRVDNIPRSDCPRLELSYDERVLLNILSSSLVYLQASFTRSTFKPLGILSERSFRKYMEKLCSKDFVKAIGDKRGGVYEVIGHA